MKRGFLKFRFLVFFAGLDLGSGLLRVGFEVLGLRGVFPGLSLGGVGSRKFFENVREISPFFLCEMVAKLFTKRCL